MRLCLEDSLMNDPGVRGWWGKTCLTLGHVSPWAHLTSFRIHASKDAASIWEAFFLIQSQLRKNWTVTIKQISQMKVITVRAKSQNQVSCYSTFSLIEDRINISDRICWTNRNTIKYSSVEALLITNISTILYKIVKYSEHLIKVHHLINCILGQKFFMYL